MALACLSLEASARSGARTHPTTLRIAATAYCSRGVTRDGDRTRPGTLAADPRVLPLGTTVRFPPRRDLYTVTDTGSAVKGRRLDIFMPSCRQARAFGRRRVRVQVVSRPLLR